jgi:hypothetical protein
MQSRKLIVARKPGGCPPCDAAAASDSGLDVLCQALLLEGPTGDGGCGAGVPCQVLPYGGDVKARVILHTPTLALLLIRGSAGS